MSTTKAKTVHSEKSDAPRHEREGEHIVTADHKGSPVAVAIGQSFAGGQYALPPLPYAHEALEPHIDAETMRLHHDKHHKAYVDNWNKTNHILAELRAAKEIDQVKLNALQEDLTFNASGHILHSVFWATMAPNAGGEPSGAFAEVIAKDFGSFAGFKAHFSKAAAGVKGAGWAVLVYEPVGDALAVLQVRNHDLQGIWGSDPLLPLDVWEHAYYLKYKNARADYVAAWWNVVNWKAVGDTYAATRRMYGR
jgi:Fe-Mn family superoxide dismutase